MTWALTFCGWSSSLTHLSGSTWCADCTASKATASVSWSLIDGLVSFQCWLVSGQWRWRWRNGVRCRSRQRFGARCGWSVRRPVDVDAVDRGRRDRQLREMAQCQNERGLDGAARGCLDRTEHEQAHAGAAVRDVAQLLVGTDVLDHPGQERPFLVDAGQDVGRYGAHRGGSSGRYRRRPTAAAVKWAWLAPWSASWTTWRIAPRRRSTSARSASHSFSSRPHSDSSRRIMPRSLISLRPM